MTTLKIETQITCRKPTPGDTLSANEESDIQPVKTLEVWPITEDRLVLTVPNFDPTTVVNVPPAVGKFRLDKELGD